MAEPLTTPRCPTDDRPLTEVTRLHCPRCQRQYEPHEVVLGRPSLRRAPRVGGVPVNLRLGPLLTRIDERVAMAGGTRSTVVRELLERALADTETHAIEARADIARRAHDQYNATATDPWRLA